MIDVLKTKDPSIGEYVLLEFVRYGSGEILHHPNRNQLSVNGFDIIGLESIVGPTLLARGDLEVSIFSETDHADPTQVSKGSYIPITSKSIVVTEDRHFVFYSRDDYTITIKND